MPDLARAMQTLLPESVAVAWADPRRDYPLMPGEGLARAIPARQREFAAGRAAARGAMVLLGLPPAPVSRTADRAPVWPPGLTGSITHTKTDCLAAITKERCALGIDMEHEGRVTADLSGMILGADEDSRHADVIFSAKEAVYKAQYPLTGLLFGFDRLRVTLDGPLFHACFRADTRQLRAGTVWTGRHTRADGNVLAAIHVAL